VSVFGDAMSAVRNVILMQATLERMERQIEKLDDNQDRFREALFLLSERLTRVETLLHETPRAQPRRRALPKE